MKILILFKSNTVSPTDRIAAWVERELRSETIAVDMAQVENENALQHYMDWCDKAIIIGPFAANIVERLADKPKLHLFADGVDTNMTVFFDKPESIQDQETKKLLIRRLQLFERFK